MVKLRDFLYNLTIVILKSTRLGFDFKTNSKKTLNALSNGIYKMVFRRPDFWETFVKVYKKLVSLPIFISKFDKRTLYALLDGIYFYRPYWSKLGVKVDQHWTNIYQI